MILVNTKWDDAKIWMCVCVLHEDEKKSTQKGNSELYPVSLPFVSFNLLVNLQSKTWNLIMFKVKQAVF